MREDTSTVSLVTLARNLCVWVFMIGTLCVASVAKCAEVVERICQFFLTFAGSGATFLLWR